MIACIACLDNLRETNIIINNNSGQKECTGLRIKSAEVQYQPETRIIFDVY